MADMRIIRATATMIPNRLTGTLVPCPIQRKRYSPPLQGTNTIDLSRIKTYTVHVGDVYYRGVCGQNAPQFPSRAWLTPSRDTATLYSWKLEDPKHMRKMGNNFVLVDTCMYTYHASCEFELICLDDVETVNELRRYFEQYDKWTRANYGCRLSLFHSVYFIEEENNEPVVRRYSTDVADAWILSILGQLGFGGYHVGRVRYPKWYPHKTIQGEEIGIVDPCNRFIIDSIDMRV